MKLTYYLKVGFKAWLVTLIAGAIVMIPMFMFLFPLLGFTVLFSQQTSVSSFMHAFYLLAIPFLLTAQGFALYKYKGWIFR